MKLSELTVGQGKVNIEGTVKSKADVRTFNKFGKDLKVCNAVITDSSGEMILSLWNDDVDKVNVGDTVKITNGYVSEYNGVKQLGAGKFGKLEVAGKDSEGSDQSDSSNSSKSEAKPAKKKKASEIEEQEF